MSKKNVIITIISVLILVCIFAFARTTTTDLGLVKPTWDEDIDILADLNANSDILEAFANDVLEFDLSPVLRANLDIATFNIEGVDATEFGYVDGVTSDVQTQFGLRYLKTEMDSFSEIQAIISDKTLVNEEDVCTIDANWVNTAHPWADDEVANDITINLATLATTFTCTDNESEALACPLVFVDGATGAQGAETDGDLTYNPSTGKITATGFVGALTGNADTVTTNANLTGIVTSTGNATAIANKAIAIAKLADGTDGELITWDATGVIATVPVGTATHVLTSGGTGVAPTFQAAAGGGYTTFAEFDEESNWKVYYSDGSGDITELALGADGTYLKSGGAAVAPAWETPAGSGTVTTSGTPVDDDYAKFTAATVVEGRSYAEMKTDLGYMTDLVDDTAPDLGGEMDAGAHSIGFTLQTDTGTGAKTIDWKLGNKMKFTFGAGNVTFTFTAPTNPCTLMLTIIQDGTGSRTITWPATVKWPGGTEGVLTTTANARDKVALDWDGSQYDAVISKDFK